MMLSVVVAPINRTLTVLLQVGFLHDLSSFMVSLTLILISPNFMAVQQSVDDEYK